MPNTVPAYGLYADATVPATLPDPVHIETIAARSHLHDWSFEPHRHTGLHQVLWVTKGGGRAFIDGITRGLTPMTALFMPSLTVHGFAFTPGTQGWVVSIAATLALPWPETALQIGLSKPANQARMSQLCDALAQEYGTEAPARDDALEAHARLLAVWLLRHGGLDRPVEPAQSARRRLMRRFTQRLEERYRHHDSVAEYAAALGVTPTHLTRTCQQTASKPATALIQDRVILEAKRQLAYSDARVSRIADELGFSSAAYFTRLFSARVGVAPSVFRTRNARPN